MTPERVWRTAQEAAMTRTFVAPTSLDEALAALAAGARPVAGGTDLVVGARQGKAPLPDALLAIHRIDALRGIEETDGGGLRLGALATHEEIVAHPAVRERFAALADASAIVGSHATRAQGTIGGNVMNASPAMDAGGPLLCFDGSVTLRSATGERVVPIADLWTGPGDDRREGRRAARRRSTCPRPPPAPARATSASSTGARWRSPSWARPPSSRSTAARSPTPAWRSRRWPPRSAGSPEAEEALVGSDGGEDAVEAAAGRRPRRPPPSATCAAPPSTAWRWPR